MDFFDWYWPIWLIIGFGVPEAVALFREERGDTLSEKVWAWFGTARSPKGPLVKTRRVILISILVWLIIHWVTGGWV